MALPSSHSTRLSDLEVLVLDCQATAAAPRGHLLELGWARVRATTASPHSCLIQLPPGERIPPAVARITGIVESLVREGIDPALAFRRLSEHAGCLAQQPAPTVIHFAKFERGFLQTIGKDVAPLEIVCTHDIARRLLPDLPRCSLRALTGYFGQAVGALRRSASHVEATAFLWRQLIPLLEGEGVSTWDALREWLAVPAPSNKTRRRVWPMPREMRLSLPDAPGVYRMLRTSGDVLYVGKASSLHQRVNSYFRKQSGVHERLLEMLSQARAISFDVAPSALEAALLESDEIKRLQPPYNVALAVEDRTIWYAARDLSARSRRPTPRCPLGPFPSAETIDRFAALAKGDRAALARGRWGPDAATFYAGFARLRQIHSELSSAGRDAHGALLRLGTRLWREGRRDRDADDVVEPGADLLDQWTPERVQFDLEWIALRAALARRRARWLTRLVDAVVVWSEPGVEGCRLLVLENGEILARTCVEQGTSPPVPPGHRRSVAGRRGAFSVATFDRLRVLTTELKRVAAASGFVAVRVGEARPLSGERLARVLAWV